ncbi:hypothetical protein Glove_360g46 [Diversispora epigaea]|uniref:Uncharacterized protein n=1 Tax=Diversispora epigaea TaxID=1348612 RepID=A0A397HA78_9GLOM|nr:hypothetical protein Glove_360g46 [Diversispora epigaea]
MFGRIDYPNNKRKLCTRVLLVWIIIILFTQVCHASLFLYDKNNSALGTFSTVDFMWVNNFCKFDSPVNGSLNVASFLGDKSKPCALNPIPNDTSILLVPLNDGLNNNDCTSYADIVSSNSWLQIPSTNQANENNSNIIINRKDHVNIFSTRDISKKCSLRIVILVSTNKGDPGVREPYNKNFKILSKAAPKLILIKAIDINKVKGLLNKTSYAIATPDSGSWIELINSKGFLIWTIIFGILYGCIVTFSLYILLMSIFKYGIALANPRPWLLVGVISSSTLFLVILEYDPGLIRFDRLSELEYATIQMSGYFILRLCYSIFLFPWIKATRNISEELSYRASRVRKISRVFLIGIFLSILIKIAAFVFVLFEFSLLVNLGENVFKNVFIVLESVFVFILVLSYAVFGIIMVLARRYEHLPVQHIVMPRVSVRIRKEKTKQEIFKSAIITILLISSLLLITIHTIFTIFLPPTINNFWITRILDDISFTFGFLTLIIALQYDSVVKYSHMIYTGSSDDNATISTLSPAASRNSSFNNNNNSNGSKRQKRNTVDTFFS